MQLDHREGRCPTEENEIADVFLKASTECPVKPLSRPETHWFCILDGPLVLTKSVKCNYK